MTSELDLHIHNVLWSEVGEATDGGLWRFNTCRADVERIQPGDM